MPIYTGPYANSGIPNALKAVGRRATVLREWQVFSRTRFQIVQLVASRFREDLCLDAAEIIEKPRRASNADRSDLVRLTAFHPRAMRLLQAARTPIENPSAPAGTPACCQCRSQLMQG